MATVPTFTIKQADGSVVEIDANKLCLAALDALNTVAGTAGESASPAGDTGSLSAKARRITTQLDDLNTSGTKDAGPAWATVWGVSNAPVQSADMSSIADVTGTPVSGQKLVITDVLASAAVAMKLTFTEETSGLVMFSIYLGANSPVQITFRSKRKLNVADKKLRCTASVTGNVSILVGHYSEA